MRKETVLCQLRPCHYEPTIDRLLNVRNLSKNDFQIFSLQNTENECASRQPDQRTRSNTASLDAAQPKSTNHDTVDGAKTSQNVVRRQKLKLSRSNSSKFYLLLIVFYRKNKLFLSGSMPEMVM